jgi:hypothetical protein
MPKGAPGTGISRSLYNAGRVGRGGEYLGAVEPDQGLSRNDVLTMLGACPERVRDCVLGIDTGRLGYRHGPAFPTLEEMVAHLSDAGAAFEAALRHAVMEGAEEVDIKGALEAGANADESRPAADRLDDLGRLRRRTMDLLRGLPEADWEGRVLHDPHFGDLSLIDFCRLVAAHEMSHLSQVRNLSSLLPEPEVVRLVKR